MRSKVYHMTSASASQSTLSDTARSAAIYGAHRHGRVHHRLTQVIVLVQDLVVLLAIERVQVELKGAYDHAYDGHDYVFNETGAIPRVHEVTAAACVYHLSSVDCLKVVTTTVDSLSL